MRSLAFVAMLALYALTAALALYALTAAIAARAEEPMPFEAQDCGTIGNTLGTFAAARDAKVPEGQLRAWSAEALEQCIQEHGKMGCSVRNEEQAKFISDAITYLYKHPEVDGGEYAMSFYTRCTQKTSKPS
jgi:hypothetical protein